MEVEEVEVEEEGKGEVPEVVVPAIQDSIPSTDPGDYRTVTQRC